MDFTPLEEFLDHLTRWRIPGNCVSVCLENREVFTYASGYENYEEKIETSGKKLYNIFSYIMDVALYCCNDEYALWLGGISA